MTSGVAHAHWSLDQELRHAHARQQADRIRRQIELIEAEVEALRAVLDRKNDDRPEDSYVTPAR